MSFQEITKFGGRFINGQSAFLWVQFEYIFSPTCSFIRMRQEFIKQSENKLGQLFNFTFYYIDDVLSLNDYKLGDFNDRIYPIKLQGTVHYKNN